MPTWQYFFDQDDKLLKEVWVGHEWKPKLWLRGSRFFSLKNQSLTWSWPLDWSGCFGEGIKWDALSFFKLWAWPLEASHYDRLSQAAVGVHDPKVWTLDLIFGSFTLYPTEGSNSYTLTTIFAHFFGLSTKFSRSIPRPLDLDGHSVTWPLFHCWHRMIGLV